MTSLSDLDKEIARLIALYNSLHGLNKFTADDITNDIMRQYIYLNRQSVLEQVKYLIKGIND